jgi:ankyrin repeat protein
VQLLIEHNADVDMKNDDGKTAVDLAVWRGHEAMMQLPEAKRVSR